MESIKSLLDDNEVILFEKVQKCRSTNIYKQYYGDSEKELSNSQIFILTNKSIIVNINSFDNIQQFKEFLNQIMLFPPEVIAFYEELGVIIGNLENVNDIYFGNLFGYKFFIKFKENNNFFTLSSPRMIKTNDWKKISQIICEFTQIEDENFVQIENDNNLGNCKNLKLIFSVFLVLILFFNFITSFKSLFFSSYFIGYSIILSILIFNSEKLNYKHYSAIYLMFIIFTPIFILSYTFFYDVL